MLFTSFAIVSLFKGLSGEASCGCFGAMQVNPWLTATLDIAIVVLLLCCWKSVGMTTKTFQIRRVALVVALWTIVAAPSFYVFYSAEIDDLSALGTEFVGSDGRKTILLEPEKWSKSDFPILQYIEPAEVRELLKAGDCTIVFYRYGCSRCEETMFDLESKGASKVVCVEVPPYGVADEVPVGFVRAKLTDRLAWIVETPVVINNTADTDE